MSVHICIYYPGEGMTSGAVTATFSACYLSSLWESPGLSVEEIDR